MSGDRLMVPIHPAMSPTDSMNEKEIGQFLRESKIPLKLGTIDRHGDPVIHPLWYHYESGKFYLITASNSKKLANISVKNRVYFCVDTESRPYKGVKGKGTLGRIVDGERSMLLAQKIITKYMGSVENPLERFLTSRLREGKETLLEITPHYYSVWDDSKSP